MNEKWNSIVNMASFESKKKKRKETEREREEKKIKSWTNQETHGRHFQNDKAS